MQEKQACLLRPGTIHAIGRCGEADTIMKMVIPRAVFEKCGASFVKTGGETLTVMGEISEQVEYFLFKILEERLQKREHAADAITGYLTLMFIELSRAPYASNDELDDKLADYFESCNQGASLGGFAAALGYSEGYVGRMIKEKLGDSFSALLGRYRLKKAAAMLESSDLAVEDIARELGYANSSGLYKQFCGFYGMTPKSYRNMFR